MSHVVVKSLPFATHFTFGSARELIARDRERAQKIVQGLHPHGPRAFRESRRARRHHNHNHNHNHRRGEGGDAADPAPGSAPAPAPPSGGSGTGTDSGGVDVTDAGVTYTASVGVGSPATQYTLLIDTGSSNTWVGADQQYVQTSTSQSTGKSVNVSYGSGSFSGTEFTDQVTIAPGLVIQKQSIGVATQAQGFQGVDGILGVGPTDLTSGTVSGTSTVPTVTDNLFAQGTIAGDSLGIFFEPTTSEGALNGELTFGGTDTSKISGDVTFVPITSTSPASMYWGIDQDVSYGQDTQLLSGSAGIVDTGTTLLLLATDAFQAYQRATGATEDQATGLLSLTEDQFNNLQSMFFAIGDTTFEFTANAQIWPRALNSVIGGEEGKIYLVASDLGSPSGQGLDFINGFAWLQRFYSVFDTGNEQVGIANTPFTTATTN